MKSIHEENYLKAIFHLHEEGFEVVSTNAIAKAMNVQAASVTDMVKKLAKRKCLEHTPYQGVRLSEEGRKIAGGIIRKHRLWETFLVEKLHFNWSQVHDIAEQLEHIESELLTDRLFEFLGNPTHDPHGEPIPGKSGELPVQNYYRLDEINEGTEVEIIGVKEDSTEFLQYLNQLDLKLHANIKVLSRQKLDNTILLASAQRQFNLSDRIAASILVKEL